MDHVPIVPRDLGALRIAHQPLDASVAGVCACAECPGRSGPIPSPLSGHSRGSLDLHQLWLAERPGRPILRGMRDAPQRGVSGVRCRPRPEREVLQPVRDTRGRRRRGDGHHACAPAPARRGAPPRQRPVRRPRRLHHARRGPRRRGRPRAPDALLRDSRARSSAATAARSRSSSATRSWPSGARPSRTRTTPSAPSAPRSSSSTRSRSRSAPGLQARAGVLTGEAAVTLGADEPGHGRRRPRQHRRAPAVGGPARHGARRRGDAARRPSAAIAFEPAGEQVAQGQGRARAGVPGAARRRRARRRAAARDALEAPFVGRDDELRLLKDLFHATGRERRARLVSITGQAGIGKSRLAWEFEKYLDGIVETDLLAPGRSPGVRRGDHVLGAGRDGPRARRPRRDRRRGDDPRADRRDRSPSIVARRGRAALDRAALLALLGVERAGRRPRASCSPPGGRSSSASPRAARSCWCSRTSSGPTRACSTSSTTCSSGPRRARSSSSRWPARAPRATARTGARRRGTSRRVALEPLAERRCASCSRARARPAGAGRSRAIVARADGIPLYAVETIRMLVADGRAGPTRTARYRPVGDLGDARRPGDPARADRRAPRRARRRPIARCSRTRPCSARLHARRRSPRVSGDAAEADSSRACARWSGASCCAVEIDPRSPERGQYAFVQALIREVAYGTLAQRDRRARHLAAARYFEALGDDELPARSRRTTWPPTGRPPRAGGRRPRRPGADRAARRRRARGGPGLARPGDGLPDVSGSRCPVRRSNASSCSSGQARSRRSRAATSRPSACSSARSRAGSRSATGRGRHVRALPRPTPP